MQLCSLTRSWAMTFGARFLVSTYSSYSSVGQAPESYKQVL